MSNFYIIICISVVYFQVIEREATSSMLRECVSCGPCCVVLEKTKGNLLH